MEWVFPSASGEARWLMRYHLLIDNVFVKSVIIIKQYDQGFYRLYESYRKV